MRYDGPLKIWRKSIKVRPEKFIKLFFLFYPHYWTRSFQEFLLFVVGFQQIPWSVTSNILSLLNFDGTSPPHFSHFSFVFLSYLLSMDTMLDGFKKEKRVRTLLKPLGILGCRNAIDAIVCNNRTSGMAMKILLRTLKLRNRERKKLFLRALKCENVFGKFTLTSRVKFNQVSIEKFSHTNRISLIMFF